MPHTQQGFGEYTDMMFEEICFSTPRSAESAEDIAAGVAKAIEIDGRKAFAEGLAERLTQLGTPCTAEDTETMLAEVRRRYKELLGKSCPRTVVEWIRGTTPGTANRMNNYDLCYALEMDCRQTSEFFRKCFLTQPFNVKSRTDAVYLYCIYHSKLYSTVTDMLEQSRGFVPQENAHTSTSKIESVIKETEDDDRFLRYLSAHCYGNEQQFQLARHNVNLEIDLLKESLVEDSRQGLVDLSSADRLNSMTIAALLGYRYQYENKKTAGVSLPKRITESLPNDVTLGKVINGGNVSYELLRKTLMLLRFYNYYHAAGQMLGELPHKQANEILLDFYDELDSMLLSCGFAQLYILHPFDCMLLYCANTDDPLLTLHSVIEYGRN